MKLGFYVDSCGGTPQNVEIYNFLNKQIESGNIIDAAVFFNSVNFNPVQPHFGMFDATELWGFTGNLVATSIGNVVKAKNIVNRFNLAYLFKRDDKKEQNIFELVKIASDTTVLVTNQPDAELFHRLTGVQPVLVEKWTVEKIREIFHE